MIPTLPELKHFSLSALEQLCIEIRARLISTVLSHGGHFAPGLGVVELAVALHHCFDSPTDKLFWDTGHQAYPHKLLTGRAAALNTVGDLNGLCPFPSPEESEHDPCIVGHCGNVLSVACGAACASKPGAKHIVIVGDGALTAGMNFEALNQIGILRPDLFIIVNYNACSISENQGALHSDPSRLRTLFESFSIPMEGPLDGHNLAGLIESFRRYQLKGGPAAILVNTKKGKGYLPAEEDPEAFHAVRPEALPTPPTNLFSQALSAWLLDTARQDDALVAVTPAMGKGMGLKTFAQAFPERFFDVGIAEQHAVAFAAGLCLGGKRPIVCTYATFFQRAFDQLIHDIAIPKLPVWFAMDRAGLVEADGATHQGTFDLGFLNTIPNFTICLPCNPSMLKAMLSLCWQAQLGPVAFRYPKQIEYFKGSFESTAMPTPNLQLGRGAIIKQGLTRCAVLNFGALLGLSEHLAAGLQATLVDMRFLKPLDTALLDGLAKDHTHFITVEDHIASGGAWQVVAAYVTSAALTVKLFGITLPDGFAPHGSLPALRKHLGYCPEHLLRTAQSWLTENA